MSTEEDSDDSARKTRTVHRVVTMSDLTPNDTGGYMMAGDTTAEVEVGASGVRIRTKGKREPWRFLPWSEVWINAVAER